MIRLSAAAILCLLAVSAPVEARRRPAGEAPGASPRKFTIESGLPADSVVQCLAADRKTPAVLAIDGGRRVLLGPARGWVDVYGRRGATTLVTRTEWVNGRDMERVATRCASAVNPQGAAASAGGSKRPLLKRLLPGSSRG